MSSSARLLTAVLIAVSAIVVVLVAGFVVAPRWDRGEGGTFTVRDARVATTVEPRGALVGDRVTATALVVVDADRIDPRSVRLDTRFAPFAVVGTTRTVDTGIGDAAFVRYRYSLQCLTVDCLTAMEVVREGKTLSRPIPLRDATLVARTREGSTERVAVEWPSVNLRSRIDQRDIDLVATAPAAFRTPGITYRVSPTLVGWMTVGLAIGLILVGAWLIALAVRGKRAVRRLRIPDHLSGVDRALALLDFARESGDVEGERRALERLAAELRDDGDLDGSEAARRLAWSREGLHDEELDEFRAGLVGARDGR